MACVKWITSSGKRHVPLAHGKSNRSDPNGVAVANLATSTPLSTALEISSVSIAQLFHPYFLSPAFHPMPISYCSEDDAELDEMWGGGEGPRPGV
ncbi:hypothetical protein SKAU_G00364180 [Synaphobranchus kaupii]|uniref:Uncharacterized protein n=1 Tax=Synaphobranchus kaupii TaxID=118154 RepID=A0A9Q1EES2_SYNKA|nr:hypothetical protein SKAU_G00364180 [Synaphobranchus kaupii]